MAEIEDMMQKVEQTRAQYPGETHRIEVYAQKIIAAGQPKAIKLFTSLLDDMLKSNDSQQAKQMLDSLDSIIEKIEGSR